MSKETEPKPDRSKPIRKASRYVLLLELFNLNKQLIEPSEEDLLGIGGMSAEDIGENWDKLRFEP